MVVRLASAAATSVLLVTGCTPAGPRPAPPAAAQHTPPRRIEPVNTSPAPTPIPEVWGVEAIQRLTPQIGFVAVGYGAGVRLLRTADGGVTWASIPTPATRITQLRFIDAETGWVVAIRSTSDPNCLAPPSCEAQILRTVDGGRTWDTTLSAPYVFSSGGPMLQAIDGDLAWVVVSSAQPNCQTSCDTDLEVTRDGGVSWRTLLRAPITAMRFASDRRGWLATSAGVGMTEVRSTDDGGVTWGNSFRPQDSDLVSLDAASASVAWYLAGSSRFCTASICIRYQLYGTVDGGIRWQPLGNPVEAGCGAGHLGGPLFASRASGWLTLNTGAGGAGSPGGLLKTADGGRTWRCVNPPTNTGPLTAADPLHLWVGAKGPAGLPSELYATDDGGTSWWRLSYADAVTG